MNSDLRQDQELKAALKRIYEEIEIPDYSESWSKVQARLDRRRRWSSIRRIRYIASIVVGIFALSFILSTSLPSALSLPSLLRNIQESVVVRFHEPDTAHTEPEPLTSAIPPPPPLPPIATAAQSSSSMVEVPLQEARELTSFRLQIPAITPEGVELNRVRIFRNEEEEYDHVHFEYIDSEGYILHVVQRQIRGVTDGLKTEVQIAAGEYKDVLIHGSPGVLVIPHEGSLHLEWLNEDRVFTRISGRLSEEAMLEFARSFERQ